MPFNEWLALQIFREDDVGTIARVATRGVDDWPLGRRVRLLQLREYLFAKFVCCPETRDLLDRMLVRARSEWRAERAAA